MHRQPVLELKNDEPVIHDFAASDFRIHDVVETRVRPLALFPIGNPLAVAKDTNRRPDSETDGAERELEIELEQPLAQLRFAT